MAGFASRQFSRMQRLAFLLSRKPHYLLGRFAVVRDSYAMMNGARDAVLGTSRLRVGDLYEEASTSIETASSGLLLPVASAAEQVEELRSQSYSLGPHLAPSTVSELHELASILPLKNALNPQTGRAPTYKELSTERTLRERNAFLTVRDSSSIAIVRALAGDTLLNDIARQFLGYKPRQVSSWLFWSLANALSDDQRRAAYQTIDFHYDVDGFNFMYVNFYLVETNRSNGAHVLMAGTARGKHLRHLTGVARLGDAEAYEAYGRERERVMEGPAGFGFLEDASCYHKALPPQVGDRLMLQLRYQ
jgi:hypothetical protein